MIKQIIASALLVSAPLNTTTTSSNVNEFQGYTEIQAENEYYEGNLERSQRCTTIAYNDLWIGTGIHVRARAMQYLDRNIAENEYITRQALVLKLDTLIQVDEWAMYLTNQPQYADFIQSGVYEIKYITGYNTEIESFYNGQKYYTYSAMRTMFDLLYMDSTWITNASVSGNRISYANHNYIGNYMIITTTYNWQNITDDGAMLNDILPYTDVSSTIVWTVPAQTGEIVDIPGMMFEILGMPFAWLSIAFNFTIFPGTAYAVNISNILMAIIVGLIGIFIVKKFIK